MCHLLPHQAEGPANQTYSTVSIAEIAKIARITAVTYLGRMQNVHQLTRCNEILLPTKLKGLPTRPTQL
ncbi:MAG: hypothetical protein HON70_02685 [Lentisphaerae bacterium]|nr:hypothetical protein [Lentisphaerota bacterium]